MTSFASMIKFFTKEFLETFIKKLYSNISWQMPWLTSCGGTSKHEPRIHQVTWRQDSGIPQIKSYMYLSISWREGKAYESQLSGFTLTSNRHGRLEFLNEQSIKSKLFKECIVDAISQ